MTFKTQAVISQLLVGLTATAAVALAAPVKADSTKAFCTFSPNTQATFPEGKSVKGECRFAQFQGNIYIDLNGVTHHYAARNQDRLYTRINRREGIWLTTPDTQMTVFWQKPTYEPAGY